MIKVIHVFGQMNKGGAETGVMQALRRIDKNRFHFDFAVSRKGKGFFDDEIIALNSRIFNLNNIRNPFVLYRDLKNINKKYGPYNIIHSRVHHFSGVVLFVSKLIGIPVRIAHSHTDISRDNTKLGIWRKIYYFLAENLIKYFSTAGLAVSESAATALFGKNWKSYAKFKVLYTGIELDPYMKSVNKRDIRSKLNIPYASFVIGHVGRLSEPKNHFFLLDIFQSLHQIDNDIYLLLFGTGPLKTIIETEVKKRKIDKNVIIAGFRDDVADLMSGAIDIFVLPSIYEGMPHVGIEAQAANLPCLFSETITKEVQINKKNTYFLPIDQGYAIWRDKILELKDSASSISNDFSYKFIEGTQFDVNKGVENLQNIYNELVLKKI